MTDTPGKTDDEAQTAAVLGQLKVRPTAEARARAFDRLQAEFAALHAPAPAAAVNATRRFPRWAMAAGLAAVVVGAVTFVSLPGTQTPAVVARVEAIEGSVDAHSAGVSGGGVHLALAGTVATGQVIEVGADSGVLLRISPALSVRLAANTRAHVTAADELELEAGAAFIDATPGARAPLSVTTRYGVVTHLGTQYLVRVGDGEVEVAVREGRAQLATDSGTRIAEHGTWLLQRAAAPPLSGALAEDDARFQWLAGLPSAFHLEGATLEQFLAWFTRETGVTPVYSAGVDARNFTHVELKGSIDDLDPFEALSYVLATADLAWHREGTRVVIENAAR